MELPDGFAETVVATGITGATAMTVAPDGRVFVCEQTGALRVVKDDALQPAPFASFPVNSYWERGLLGVALDPDFPKNGYVYVCYVAARPYPHHRISRLTAKGDVAAPGSEVILFEGDDQRKLGGSQEGGHQGGHLHFGKDGKLYLGIGEHTNSDAAQRLDTLQGKLLRINRDGTIPTDNPFYRRAKGKYRAVWALGLRNPFAFAVQPGTGRIFINDVGNARWEEIDEGVAGANYGWPATEGLTANPKYRGPIYTYDHGQGQSITGGVFYNPAIRQFPVRYLGKYFFADFMANWIRVLDPDRPQDVTPFATGLAGPVDLQLGPDGSLYVLNRNAWVKDDKFRPHTGSLHRISYVAGSGKPLPRLTTQPAEQTTVPGQPVSFRVAAAGAAPRRFQWRRNGQPIPGATGPDYEVAAPGPSDNGARFDCVVFNRHGISRSRSAALWLAELRPAAHPGGLRPGLTYAYFEGRWDYLPDLTTPKPIKQGTSRGFVLTPRRRNEHFAIAFRGLIEVPRDGAYGFEVSAAGACRLFVGGAEVVAQGLLAPPRPRSGAVGLRAGKHPLLLLLAHGAGPPALELRYSGPGLEERPVPAAALFHADPERPVFEPAGGRPPYGLMQRELVTTLNVSQDPAELPPRLSQTGVFRSLADLTPNPGIVPYHVNAPLWGDGALKRRWIALPGDARVGFRETGEWHFPAGTVFIKHFEMGTDDGDPSRRQRLETRLLVVDKTGRGYGVTYRWRPDGSDADLLPDGADDAIVIRTRSGATRTLHWHYPSRSDCLACHTAPSGFVLGVSTRQLNGPLTYAATGVTDNQLRTWNHIGLFAHGPDESAIPRLRRLVAVNDRRASLEHRVRAYLDSNCAQCHRPGGSPGEFDARFDTRLDRQKLLGGPLVAADLGVPGAKVVVPGTPEKSMIYLRMSRRHDVFRMPPLATNLVDRDAVEAVAAWIRGLPAGGRKGRDTR
jgi:uncharacterized repeat protein (TIGR03806 family)